MFLNNDNILVDYKGPKMTLEELNFLHKEGEEYSGVLSSLEMIFLIGFTQPAENPIGYQLLDMECIQYHRRTNKLKGNNLKERGWQDDYNIRGIQLNRKTIYDKDSI